MKVGALNLLGLATCAYGAVASPDYQLVYAEITLNRIKYESTVIYTTPAHMATSLGTVSFTLDNTLLPYELDCKAYATRYPDMFYGEIVYDCLTPEGKVPASETVFTFSRPDGRFTLNQTWQADGTAYLAVGSGRAELECVESEWRNPNWTMGENWLIMSEVCAPYILTLAGDSDEENQ